MFKGLKSAIKKRSFASSALLATNENLNYLFTSEEATNKYKCVAAFKKLGDETTQEFRKGIIQTVSEIVQSDNPILAMCKELILSAQSICMNNVLAREEFYKQRQIIYENMNKKHKDPEAFWSDEKIAVVTIWDEAECLCLRLLQAKMFDDLSQNDWWTDYYKLYELHVEAIYRSIIEQAGGTASTTDSVDSVLFGAILKSAQDYERKILEEAKKVTLWQ